MHLELIYSPYGLESCLKNPFAADSSMTSLEKILQHGSTRVETGEPGKSVTTKKKRDVIVRGVLSVTVIAAEDLPPADLNGKADPFVIITMKKSEAKSKTRVRHHISS